MSIDQGTTSTRAIIFDKKGQPLWTFQKELPQHFPQPGRVEHDANDIWISTLSVIAGVLIESGLKPQEIDSLGITNQRETTVIWDKKAGQPIYHAVVWQSKQTSGIADQLIADGHKEMVQDQTGLIIDSYFSVTKVKWILDRVEGSRERAKDGELLLERSILG